VFACPVEDKNQFNALGDRSLAENEEKGAMSSRKSDAS
jgi:hypothetical protein